MRILLCVPVWWCSAEFDDVEELSASEDLSPRLEDSTAHEQHNKRVRAALNREETDGEDA